MHFTTPVRENTLVGHVIRSLEVERESACTVSCYLEVNCVSLNLGPLQDGKHVCELSDSDHHIHPEDLVRRVGFAYKGTKQVGINYRTFIHPASFLPSFVRPSVYPFINTLY